MTAGAPIRTCRNCGKHQGCAGCSTFDYGPDAGVCGEGMDRPTMWQPGQPIQAMSDALDLTTKALNIAAEMLVRNLRFLLQFDTAVLNEDLSGEEQAEVQAIVDRFITRAGVEGACGVASEPPAAPAAPAPEPAQDYYCTVEDVLRLLVGHAPSYVTDALLRGLVKKYHFPAYSAIRKLFGEHNCARNIALRLPCAKLVAASALSFLQSATGKDICFQIGGTFGIAWGNRLAKSDIISRWCEDARRALVELGANPAEFKVMGI